MERERQGKTTKGRGTTYDPHQPSGQYGIEHFRQNSGATTAFQKGDSTGRDVDICFHLIQKLTRNTKSSGAERKLIVSPQLFHAACDQGQKSRKIDFKTFESNFTGLNRINSKLTQTRRIAVVIGNHDGRIKGLEIEHDDRIRVKLRVRLEIQRNDDGSPRVCAL